MKNIVVKRSISTAAVAQPRSPQSAPRRAFACGLGLFAVLLLGCSDPGPGPRPSPHEPVVPVVPVVPDVTASCGPHATEATPMTFSARWQEFEPVKLGQGSREGKLVSDIYVSFDEVDTDLMSVSGYFMPDGTLLADEVLDRFLMPLPVGSDESYAYTEASVAGLADFARELGWTSDSFVAQNLVAYSWGPLTMGFGRRLTDAGTAAKDEDQALDAPFRSRYITGLEADAYVMMGLRLSFDSEAQCKRDAILDLLNIEPEYPSLYLLLADERREEIQRHLVAFGAKLHASVVSNLPRPELEAALSRSTCDAAHLDACVELLDDLERLRQSALGEPADWYFDYDALIQQRDPVFSIAKLESGGRVSGLQ